MSADGDFAGYVAARWPRLVRTAVLLGCPDELAADVTLDALAHCQGAWAQIIQDADVDDAVLGELVAAWDRRRHGGLGWSDRARPLEEAGPGPAGLPGGLAADLDVLSPSHRAVLVLTRFAGRPGGGVDLPDEPTGERLRSAAALLPVLAPPDLEQITTRRRQEARRRRRHSVRVAAATVVPVLLLIGGLSWVGARSQPDSGDADLGRLVVKRLDNPTNVVWEAGGVLHLPHGTTPVPTLRQLAPFGDGVVYADDTGRVVGVEDDGTRTLLGHEDPDTGFVSSDTQGWAAWVDPTLDRPALVVVDVAAHHVIGRLPLTGDGTHGVEPLAIDGDTLYYADDAGARGWQPATDREPAHVVEPAALVDVAAGTRVYQISATTVLISIPRLLVNLRVVGVGGRLSDDGSLLLTRVGGDSGGNGPVALYDTATGAALQTGIDPDEIALDATFGPHQTVTYLVARTADRPGASDQLRASFAGAIRLRTCQISPDGAPPVCGLVTDIPASGISPLLAH